MENNNLENPTRGEVQAHGFTWERDLMLNVFKATSDEIARIKYNSKIDLPAEMNRLDTVDLSIKTSNNLKTVCMADCLRLFDIVNSGRPFHMVVVHYKQNTQLRLKTVLKIIEVDLTDSAHLLFGSLNRDQLSDLDELVKTVPQHQKPTKEQHTAMYKLKKELQIHSGAIQLNIKCNSTQSRLQCSFNRFDTFISANQSRIISSSNSADFRGGSITKEIQSAPRVIRKPKQ